MKAKGSQTDTKSGQQNMEVDHCAVVSERKPLMMLKKKKKKKNLADDNDDYDDDSSSDTVDGQNPAPPGMVKTL